MAKQTYTQISNDMFKRVLNVLVLQDSKRRLTMAELAVKAIIFFGLYIPLYVYSMIVTFADIRFWLLTLFAMVVGSIKLVRWLRKDDRLNEQRLQENEARRIENKMKELAMREKELEIIERENRIK